MQTGRITEAARYHRPSLARLPDSHPSKQDYNHLAASLGHLIEAREGACRESPSIVPRHGPTAEPFPDCATSGSLD
jgi:hypothetical protein